jgi:outer membrane protein assembly factor BamC
VGLVLDRVGFTVEDRDRSKGTYFVRYVDLDRRDPRQGAISRFFSGERKDLMGQRYQIALVGGTSDVTVTVRDEGGQPPATPENKRVANRIIALLHEEMK